MRYCGNYPESFAKTYKIRQFTHEEKVNGRMVQYFDCWVEEEIPGFPEDKIRKDIRGIDDHIRNNPWGIPD